jgi:hypothetical protein
MPYRVLPDNTAICDTAADVLDLQEERTRRGGAVCTPSVAEQATFPTSFAREDVAPHSLASNGHQPVNRLADSAPAPAKKKPGSKPGKRASKKAEPDLAGFLEGLNSNAREVLRTLSIHSAGLSTGALCTATGLAGAAIGGAMRGMKGRAEEYHLNEVVLTMKLDGKPGSHYSLASEYAEALGAWVATLPAPAEKVETATEEEPVGDVA